MISPNLDSEGVPPMAVDADNFHKVCAKATIHQIGTPRHGIITKRSRLEGGIAGFEEGHTVLGYFTDNPILEKPFYMARYNTEGREQYGWFGTSPVAEIWPIEAGFTFVTHNSVYTLEFTPDPLAT